MRRHGVSGVNLLGTAAATVLLFTAATAFAAMQSDYRVQTTKDLVDLCATDTSSSDYVAAIHFCHGFVSGAYQYYQSVVAATPTAKYVCAENPPSRNEAIAGFVKWTNENPKTMSARPVDSMFQYLGSMYPCK